MTRFPVKLPPGLAIGDRIVTNQRYAAVCRRIPGPREGVVLNGCQNGMDVLVHLRGVKNPERLDRRLFQVLPKDVKK